MRRINLSPEYTLPTNNDYDDVIDSMQRDVEEEGCASYFLATIRSERKYSEAMHQRVVVPLTEQAFLYEDVNFTYSDIFQEAGREEEIHTFPALRAGIISGDGSK